MTYNANISQSSFQVSEGVEINMKRTFLHLQPAEGYFYDESDCGSHPPTPNPNTKKKSSLRAKPFIRRCTSCPMISPSVEILNQMEQIPYEGIQSTEIYQDPSNTPYAFIPYEYEAFSESQQHQQVLVPSLHPPSQELDESVIYSNNQMDNITSPHIDMSYYTYDYNASPDIDFSSPSPLPLLSLLSNDDEDIIVNPLPPHAHTTPSSPIPSRQHSPIHKISNNNGFKNKSIYSMGTFGGKEPTSTVMLRNIPYNEGQVGVLKLLYEKGFESKFDFFYAPLDFNSGNNLGYAFINLRLTEFVDEFFHKFQGLRVASEGWFQKNLQVNWARVQGFFPNIEHYRNSPVNEMPIQFRPMVFNEFGVQTEFPRPDPSSSSSSSSINGVGFTGNPPHSRRTNSNNFENRVKNFSHPSYSSYNHNTYTRHPSPYNELLSSPPPHPPPPPPMINNNNIVSSQRWIKGNFSSQRNKIINSPLLNSFKINTVNSSSGGYGGNSNLSNNSWSNGKFILQKNSSRICDG